MRGKEGGREGKKEGMRGKKERRESKTKEMEREGDQREENAKIWYYKTRKHMKITYTVYTFKVNIINSGFKLL